MSVDLLMAAEEGYKKAIILENKPAKALEELLKAKGFLDKYIPTLESTMIKLTPEQMKRLMEQEIKPEVIEKYLTLKPEEQEIKDRTFKLMSKLCDWIGDSYLRIMDYDLALEYYVKAYEYAEGKSKDELRKKVDLKRYNLDVETTVLDVIINLMDKESRLIHYIHFLRLNREPDIELLKNKQFTYYALLHLKVFPKLLF